MAHLAGGEARRVAGEKHGGLFHMLCRAAPAEQGPLRRVEFRRGR